MERRNRFDRGRGRGGPSYGRDGPSYNRPPREMHPITCAECGKEDQVPFKPDGTRPVYCQECHRKRRTW